MLEYFISVAKVWLEEVGGFTISFAEITDVKNIEPWFEPLAQLITQYIPLLNKNQATKVSFF